MKPLVQNGTDTLGSHPPQDFRSPGLPTEAGGVYDSQRRKVWGDGCPPPTSRSLRGRLIIRNGAGGRLELVSEIRRFCETFFPDSRVKMVYVTNDETRAFVTTANTADERVHGCRFEEKERHHVFDIERTSLPIFVAIGR